MVVLRNLFSHNKTWFSFYIEIIQSTSSTLQTKPYIRERNIITTQADIDIIPDEERKSSNTINNDSDTSITIESNDKKIKEEEKSLTKYEEDAIVINTNNENCKEKVIELEKKESKVKKVKK